MRRPQANVQAVLDLYQLYNRSEGKSESTLDWYERAIEENPDDHGAVFNAGVMHEAMGQFKKAESCYDRAFKIEPKNQYVSARRRVRTEGGK